MKTRISLVLIFAFVVSCASAMALEWRTAWTASMENAYPVGYPSGMHELGLVFPDAAKGAVDQSFRMMARPDVWGKTARLRFSNAFGTQPVTIDGVFVGLHMSGGAVMQGTNRPVTFFGKESITIQPGELVWSDGVELGIPAKLSERYLHGRKLAVSFHVAGESGPMTWHSDGLNINYMSWPNAGSVGGGEGESAFPFSCYSWFFLDAIDMLMPSETRVIVCYGDSITDGALSTLNGDDRWPDALSRRLVSQRHPNWTRGSGTGNLDFKYVSVVNAGISGNEVAGPAEHSASKPYPGGPSAFDRLERDVLSLSGVNAIVWLEGINDLHTGEKTAEQVIDGMKRVVDHVRQRQPGIKVFAGTLVSSVGSTIKNYGDKEIEVQRQLLNDFIRTTDIFDGYVDFDSATLDRKTGMLRPEYGPDSTFGRPADWLHPNRAGYLRMAETVDTWAVLGYRRQ